MEKVPANLGWFWVKEGFALFRKQPAELSSLFLSYLFLMFVLLIIPVLGQLLQIVLWPAFSMALMQACAHIEQDKRITPNLLLTGFRSPAFRSLLKLGGLYVLASFLASAAFMLVDNGVFMEMITSGKIELTDKALQDSNAGLALLVAAAVYTPAAMALWYAAPLVFWKQMSVGKSVFYSFFAVRRAGMAFLVYGLAWVGISILLLNGISLIIVMMIGKSSLAVLILMPVFITLTVIVCCSFYPTYTSIFGQPYMEKNTVGEEDEKNE